jgi:conjugative transfer signal peptidase TraF
LTGLFNTISRLPRLTIAALIVCSGAIGLMLAAAKLGLVFNYTHSAPFGLYVETSARVQNERDPALYIFFCPDVRWPSMKGQPNYRSPMRTCPDGFSPLIKPVIAWPGDTVQTTRQGLIVNGVALSNTVPLDHDSKGRSIHPYSFGTYRVEPGQLWAVSSFSPRSFDSRYFGPIPMRSIHLWVRPLIVENTYHSENHASRGNE